MEELSEFFTKGVLIFAKALFVLIALNIGLYMLRVLLAQSVNMFTAPL